MAALTRWPAQELDPHKRATSPRRLMATVSAAVTDPMLRLKSRSSRSGQRRNSQHASPAQSDVRDADRMTDIRTNKLYSLTLGS